MEGGPLLEAWWVKVSEDFVPYLNIAAASPRDPQKDSMSSKPDQGMLSKKGGRGFPYCIFMDGEGKVLKEVRPDTESAFRAGMQPVKLLVHWRKQATESAGNAKKTATHNLQLLEAVFTPDEGRFAALSIIAKTPGVDPEVRKMYESLVARWPVQKAFDQYAKAAGEARNKRDRAAFDAAQKVFQEDVWALYQSGTTVKDESAELFDDFWIALAQAAIEKKDKAPALVALTHMEAKHKDNERAMAFLKGMRKDVESLGAPAPAGEKPKE